MFDRRERQVAHPWLTARQRSQLELPPGAESPPPLSAARQELEAAFYPPPTPAPASGATTRGDGAPEVVVKRKRAFVAPPAESPVPEGTGGPAGGAADDVDTVHSHHDRGPRVFRVDAPLLAQAQQISADGGATSLVAEDGPPEATQALPIIPTRRPRRRATPAVVTFVARHDADPQCEEASGTAVDEAPDLAAVGDVQRSRSGFSPDRGFDAVLRRIELLESTLSQIRQAQDLHFGVRDVRPRKSRKSSDEGIRAAIEKLRRQAEIMRGAEATRAIQWIKQAIAAYSLTSADLGL